MFGPAAVGQQHVISYLVLIEGELLLVQHGLNLGEQLEIVVRIAFKLITSHLEQIVVVQLYVVEAGFLFHVDDDLTAVLVFKVQHLGGELFDVFNVAQKVVLLQIVIQKHLVKVRIGHVFDVAHYVIQYFDDDDVDLGHDGDQVQVVLLGVSQPLGEFGAHLDDLVGLVVEVVGQQLPNVAHGNEQQIGLVENGDLVCSHLQPSKTRVFVLAGVQDLVAVEFYYKAFLIKLLEHLLKAAVEFQLIYVEEGHFPACY